jgi:hypothetical protein
VVYLLGYPRQELDVMLVDTLRVADRWAVSVESSLRNSLPNPKRYLTKDEMGISSLCRY